MATTNLKLQPTPDALKASRKAAKASLPVTVGPADGLMNTGGAAAHLGLKPLSLVDWRTRGVGPGLLSRIADALAFLNRSFSPGHVGSTSEMRQAITQASFLE